MVGFDGVVCVLLGDVLGIWDHLVEYMWVDRCVVGGDFDWSWFEVERVGEECLCGGVITMF